ncbi:PadR family transcriptional regulator [Devosia submarina]|uniref:PadR family transcriptional regulator n=1 Tax=Devosia submarina TaxID=1173082 RepID=UPI000D39B070|nr:PadR family transcriptional regulator [Devosia submarina]
MNVRTLCLSILFEGDATGYEIRRNCTEGECSYFLEASFGSIYPALARLEDDGLVTSRIEPQDGKPAKKIYSITEAGRQAFAAELTEALGPDIFRSPFLLFARFAHILPRDLVEQRAQEFLDRTTEKRKHLDEALEQCSANAAESWIINYGRTVMAVAEQHTRAHMHELIELARAEPNKDAAE